MLFLTFCCIVTNTTYKGSFISSDYHKTLQIRDAAHLQISKRENKPNIWK